MVLLKDILNQDNNATQQAKSPNVYDGLLDSPQSGGSMCRRKSNNSLPSPTLSASSQVSCNGNSESDGYYLGEGRRSSYDSINAGHAGTPQSETSSGCEEDQLVCQWDGCGKVYHQAELLYHHLCKDHVGRKSQRNLQLNCKWGDCEAKTEKRDHITSHIRVHIALKPFKCSTCSKNFKRPQDLKKHLKTHIESHIIFKKKRGPKIGSKRVGKKELGQKESVAKSDSAVSPLNNSATPPGQTALPLISLQQLVTNELPSYKPIYSPNLGARLSTVLPPIAADDNLPRSAPMATTNAAHFFSALSSNMMNARPGQPAYQQVNKPLVNSEPSVAALPASLTAGQLHSSTGPSTYPKVTALPPIEPQFTYDRNSMLPSLSSVPLLMPRHKTYERVPHFNNPAQYYSSIQRSSGKSNKTDDQDVVDAYASLNLADKVDVEEYDEILDAVNMIRDYLFCLLLEDEYTDVPETNVKAPPRERLSRYPEIVV